MSKVAGGGLNYTVDVDKDAVADAVRLFEFVGGNTEDAIRIAINKSAPKVRTLASREIRSQVRLQASYINERLKIVRATRSSLSGAIRTPMRGLLLSRFSTDAEIARDNKSWIKPPPVPPRGIRVKVKPRGANLVFQGDSDAASKPFYLVLKNSHALGIATRRKTPGPKGGSLKVYHGPSLSQVFNTVRNDVLPEASAEYQSQLLDAMRYILARKMPPEG